MSQKNKYLDYDGVRYLWDKLSKSLLTISKSWNNIINKEVQVIIRNNKFFGISNWDEKYQFQRPIYAPYGVAYVDAITPTSFVIGAKTYNVPAGISYIDLDIISPISNDDMSDKLLRQNSNIRKFGLYLDSSNITSLVSIFNSATNLECVDVDDIDTHAVTHMGWAFYGCSSLTTLDLNNWDTSACANMDSMFYNCSSLTSLDLNNWDTSACTNMFAMFHGCSSLTSLDLNNWDTSACTNMEHMFHNCTSLTSLGLSNWNTSACKNVASMFANCPSLISLDLSNWNLNNCDNVGYIFADCTSLVEVNLTNWNLTWVSVDCMFYNCSSLQSLDLGSWNIYIKDNIFYNCSSLQSLDLSSWGISTSNGTGYHPFRNCTSLTSLKFPNMGALSSVYTSCSINLEDCPLDHESLENIFSREHATSYPLSVRLSNVSKSLLTPEEIAEITSKGYTIA